MLRAIIGTVRRLGEANRQQSNEGSYDDESVDGSYDGDDNNGHLTEDSGEDDLGESWIKCIRRATGMAEEVSRQICVAD